MKVKKKAPNQHTPKVYDWPGREEQLARIRLKIGRVCRGELEISPFAWRRPSKEET